jgi:hypothetical protein
VEAVNSSATLAAYADAVIHIEEQSGFGTVQYDNFASSSERFLNVNTDEVPKTARFLDVVVAPAELINYATTPQHSSSLDLACTRLVKEDRFDLELYKYRYNLVTSQYNVEEVATFSAHEITDRC